MGKWLAITRVWRVACYIGSNRATIMTEIEEKAAFAALLIRYPKEPFKAALELWPLDVSLALRRSNEWPNDKAVLAELKRLRNEGDDMEMLPGKSELAIEVWNKMQDCSADDFAKLAKLYAELRGYIEKPSPSTNVNVFTQKCIEVPTLGSNQEWEDAVAKQQTELLNVSRSKH